MYSYTVIGTGSVGGYYGARLALGGAKVSFLARSDYQHITEKGLKIDSCAGDFSLFPVSVYSSVQHLRESDVIIIALKTTENENLRTLLSPLVKAGTILLVLQNGLGMEEELELWFPTATIIGGMCFICSEKTGPGHITHLDRGAIHLEPLNESGLQVVSKLELDFERAQVPILTGSSLQAARWKKLLWNIPFNGTSVILNANTKEILANPASRRLIHILMEDVFRGAHACGHDLGSDAIEKMFSYTESLIPYNPSMKHDYNSGKPLEIEYMYTKPLITANACGVQMNAVALLKEQLEYMSEKRIGERI